MDEQNEQALDVEETLPADFKIKLKEIREQYPGCVSVMPAGDMLYHYSRDPEGLSTTNAFDVTKLHHPDYGGYFTLEPNTNTNIALTTQVPMIFFDDRQINAPQYFEDTIMPEAQKRRIGTSKILIEAGFDGQISRISSGLIARKNHLGERVQSLEVNIFTPALPNVSGGISKYTQVGKI